MSYGLAGQFWKGENAEVVFNDLSRAYFRKLWRRYGYELVLPMPFERFAEVTERIALAQMSAALEALGDSSLGRQARAALAQPAQHEQPAVPAVP